MDDHIWTALSAERLDDHGERFVVTLQDAEGRTMDYEADETQFKELQKGKPYCFGAEGTLKRYVNVAAAVMIKDGRVFATQRGYGDAKDRWEFPGGKIEPGETVEQAIVREIREELATEIVVDRSLVSIQYEYPDFCLSMECLLCRVISGRLTLLEHEASAWLGREELDSVDWLPADVLALDAVRALL